MLCERGFHVSGSDKNAGGICEKLKALGAVVYQGHASGQVNGADAVVISSAIHPDNCELVAAKEQGIKVMHRSDVLAELLNHADGVAVCGCARQNNNQRYVKLHSGAGRHRPKPLLSAVR